MTNLKKPMDQSALDALTLGTDEARAAYQEQRQTLEIGRAIRHDRHERKRADGKARNKIVEAIKGAAKSKGAT